MRGDTERCGEALGDVGRHGETWGDVRDVETGIARGETSAICGHSSPSRVSATDEGGFHCSEDPRAA